MADELPREIERKYLLRGLPIEAAAVAAVDIEQGWLPGSKILERLRRAKSGADTRYYRTIKLGSGLERVEVEEEIDEALFAALWPLTARRRIAKRRHRVTDASTALVWEIDDFAGRDLVVAEIELPAVATAVAPPPWLAPYVIREVTEDPAFTNYQLAGQPPP